MSDLPVLAEWTNEQKELIKRTVAQEASDSELAMFLHIASRAGLDPLQKQIHFTKRQGRVTVIAGIDGLQARAAREKDFMGILSGVVCAQDEFVYDATTGKVVQHSYNAFGDRGPIKGAWATVQRTGMLPFTAVVRFEEFNQPNSPTWRQMPSVMIGKVAKSTALRMAYPEQFSAIYEGAEMDQAGPKEAPTRGREAVQAAIAGEVVEVKPVPAPVVHDFSSAPIDELNEMEEKMTAWLAKNPKDARKRTEGEAKLAAIKAEIALRFVGPPADVQEAQVSA